METRRIMLIYIAGPYTTDTTYRVKMNILAAEYRAIEVMKTGMNMYPVCPHKNTEFMEGLRDGDYFIQGTKELMLRCDAVLLVDTDCANSVGTQGEIAAAKEAGIPVVLTHHKVIGKMRCSINFEKSYPASFHQQRYEYLDQYF